MSVTRLAIERNRVTLVGLLLLLLAGVSAFLGMPQSEDPGFTVRTALVLTYFPGASPERVEQLVTDKLEKVIQEMPQLDSILSQSKTGVSIVTVNVLESYKEMRPIWDDLRRKVDRAGPDLPDGVIGPIVNDEFGDVFGTVLTLVGDGYSYAELKDVVRNVPVISKNKHAPNRIRHLRSRFVSPRTRLNERYDIVAIYRLAEVHDSKGHCDYA